MMSLVSCIIPTYKRSDTLGRAIDSVLSQTYKDIEVLVVDDNEKGTPESADVETIVKSYADNRVKLVTQPQHINGAEARNAGIRASKGDFIAFLDDDDEWLPEKIRKQVERLNSHPEVGGVSCLYNEYSKGIIFHSCPPYTGEGLHKKVFERSVAVFTSTLLLRKEALLDAGVFDTNLRRHQDLQLLLDFTGKYDIDVLNEYLVKLHSDSAINRPDLAKFLLIKKDFFNSVATHFERYSRSEKREILAAHYFEVVKVAVREKNIPVLLKYLWKIGLNPKAYKNVYKRFKEKKFVAE